jgi:hypothetical protein
MGRVRSTHLLEAAMDLKLQLLESFSARGDDGKDYKVFAYERMSRDDTVHDGQERWLPTGVTEYRLASGELIDARADGSMAVVHNGITLRKD